MGLLTLSYWFGVNPPPFIPAVERALLIAFAIWTVGGIGAYLYLLKSGIDKMVRRAIERVAALLTWSGLTALMLWFFEYERIPVLSMRFFYVLLLAWIVAAAYFIWKYVFVEIPQTQAVQAERAAQMKWIPRKKK